MFSYSTLNDEILIKREGAVKRPFTEPTLDEVRNYFTEKGYYGGEDFYNYYANAEPSWTDKNRDPVKNWQAKARQVWFKDNRKIPESKSNQNYTGMVF